MIALRVIIMAALASSALGLFELSAAQSYPNKPIRIVSGFAPGGGIDIMARVLSPKLVEALARAKPGMLNFSSGGNGTTQHLSGELFKLRTVTSMTHVPYKGTLPSLTALLGGQVELNFANIPSVIEFTKGGRLRTLASTTAARTALFPEVPTMRESGVDMVVVVWYSLLAPAATPREIIHKLAEATAKAAQSSEIRKRLTDLGAEPLGLMPDEAAKFLRDEIALWATVVKASGAHAD